jgi:hypothetical protein
MTNAESIKDFRTVTKISEWTVTKHDTSIYFSWKNDSTWIKQKVTSVQDLFKTIRSNYPTHSIKTKWGTLDENFELLTFKNRPLYDAVLETIQASAENIETTNLNLQSWCKILSKNGRIISLQYQTEMCSPVFGYPHQLIRFETFDLIKVKPISLTDLTDTLAIIVAFKDYIENGQALEINTTTRNLLLTSMKNTTSLEILDSILQKYFWHISIDKILRQFRIVGFDPIAKQINIDLIHIETIPADPVYIHLKIPVKEPYLSDLLFPDKTDMFYDENNQGIYNNTIIPSKMLDNSSISQTKFSSESIINIIQSANAFYKKGKKQEAVKQLVDYISSNNLELNITTLTLFNDLAFYYEQTGRYQDGLNILLDIVTKFPNRTVAFINLGDTYSGLNNVVKAKEAYTTYISLMKKDGKEAKIPKRVFDMLK